MITVIYLQFLETEEQIYMFSCCKTMIQRILPPKAIMSSDISSPYPPFLTYLILEKFIYPMNKQICKEHSALWVPQAVE
jgi:hypothetical protein